MKFGIQQVIQNHTGHDDTAMFRNEVESIIESEQMGFDIVWTVEHHFTDYSLCPDNMQYLTYIAARTKRLQLATGAIIVPWNDPLRVVEKMVMLDHLSDGRAVLGLGRGLARREYQGFRQDMSEARERFNEAAEMIVRGLEEGFVDGSGQFYPQPRVEVRPRPYGSFAGRRYQVCMSPDSFEISAELGLGAMMFSQYPWEQLKDQVESYRADFRAKQGEEPPPLAIADFVVCHNDVKKAEEIAREKIIGYLMSVLDHYEMLDKSHFAETGASYQHYANAADQMKEMGMDKMCDGFLEANLWGDPAMIRDKMQQRREIIGDYETSGIFSFQSLPYDEVKKMMRLFAEEVGPMIHGWDRLAA